jgi:hypothetical protein
MKSLVLSIISVATILWGGLTFEAPSGSASPQISIYSGNLTIRVVVGVHPVAGAKVTLSQMRSAFDIRTHTKKTNTKGECTFKGLVIGTYGVHVEVPGYSSASDSVAVGPGLFTHVREYEVLPNQAVMGVITGTIADKFGKGIEKAEVTIVEGNTGIEHVVNSARGGVYEQTELVPGKYLIHVEAEKYRPTKRKVLLKTRQVAKQDFKLMPR